jgi:O-methyltransferase involved in polyketide biosynthesis
VSEPPEGSDAVSPTAHYTGYVWAKHGLSHPALTTRAGRLFFDSMRPSMAVSKVVVGTNIEGFLLARHLLIDLLLEEGIASGQVEQVLEIACGMSPRGWRFGSRYGDQIDYVEADLPAMARRKREALQEIGSLSAHHRVEDIDALAESGPMSLDAITAGFDPKRGLAVVTEGLIHYLDPESLAGLWRRIASTLSGFSDGFYLSDLHLEEEAGGVRADAFRLALSAFVRGKVHPHFSTETEALAALRQAGFQEGVLHRPLDYADQLGDLDERGASMVRVIEASPEGASAAR